MSEIKMNVTDFANNREALQSKSNQLTMKLNKQGGSTTAETINGYVKVIEKLNSQFNNLKTELNAVGNELTKIQEGFESADKKASDTVG